MMRNSARLFCGAVVVVCCLVWARNAQTLRAQVAPARTCDTAVRCPPRSVNRDVKYTNRESFRVNIYRFVSGKPNPYDKILYGPRRYATLGPQSTSNDFYHEITIDPNVTRQIYKVKCVCIQLWAKKTTDYMAFVREPSRVQMSISCPSSTKFQWCVACGRFLSFLNYERIKIQIYRRTYRKGYVQEVWARSCYEQPI